MSVTNGAAPDADACPVRDVLDRIGDRWSMLVLLTLRQAGTLRFTALKMQIGDVSQRMLAQTLRRLEQDGLVSRTAFATVPPRVDYALTPLGTSLLVPLMGLVEWAAKHHGQLRAARAAYRESAAMTTADSKRLASATPQ
jgi:DNA-binding HxlR family transcriptional regulator